MAGKGVFIGLPAYDFKVSLKLAVSLARFAQLAPKHGIDINKQGPKNGYTALHDAIWENNIDTARVIVEAGADLTLQSHSGETPLDFAKSKHRRDIVAMIEARG